MTFTTPTIHIPVEYDDPRHLYGLGIGKPGFIRYWSSTQVVEKFYEKFDARPRAEAYAAKHGGTPEYWLEQWADNRDKSLVRGNTIHSREEMILQSRMIDIKDGTVLPVHGEMIADTTPWIERPDGVYTERLLWHHGYRIAGRADKIILETPHSCWIDGQLHSEYRVAHIEDHKTNKELKKVGFQFKNGTFKMMRPPIAHLMDCNFVHYELQLSLYMFMLEYQGFRPGKMTVIHYPHPTDENPHPEKEYHDVRYLKKEVVTMLAFLNRMVA
jgi:hypothetical protein